MTARAAAVASAGLVLAAAWYWRQVRAGQADGQGDELELGEPYVFDRDTDTPPSWADDTMATVNATWNLITGTPASSMRTSPEGLAALRKRERLMLTRYELGDGGWTIGYGHFTPYGDTPPPQRITEAEAEQIFAVDVAERGERWVKAYVTAPLQQHEFDALVSMAFNLSPKSFRNIAEAVNRGEDPEAQALRYVRAGSNLEAGLRNRRAHELAMFRTGTYA